MSCANFVLSDNRELPN